MIPPNFISMRAFTDYMENSLRIEISLRSIWPKWNLYRCEIHFAWTHVNANNEVTLQLRKILPQSEISNQFQFTSDPMQTCSYLKSSLFLDDVEKNHLTIIKDWKLCDGYSAKNLVMFLILTLRSDFYSSIRTWGSDS